MQNKNNEDKMKLMSIINVSLYEIIEDETGNTSYRKYFDRVLKDIFGCDNIVTSMLVSSNPINTVRGILSEPQFKSFCKMMSSKNDVEILKQLCRVGYDAAQIANKPKKNVMNRDIKSYRYLCDLYKSGIKKLRKKYSDDVSGRKSYKNKYENLNRLINGKSKNTMDSYYVSAFMNDDDDEYDEDDEDQLSFEESMDIINQIMHNNEFISDDYIEDDDDEEDNNEDYWDPREIRKYNPREYPTSNQVTPTSEIIKIVDSRLDMYLDAMLNRKFFTSTDEVPHVETEPVEEVEETEAQGISIEETNQVTEDIVGIVGNVDNSDAIDTVVSAEEEPKVANTPEELINKFNQTNTNTDPKE